MLILLHALHNVDSCNILYLTSNDTVLYTVLVSVLSPAPPLHTHTHTQNIFFSNLDPSLSKFTRELKIRVNDLYLKGY